MANKETVMKTKLAFDGEKEYKSICKDISNSIKVLGSEMKVLSQEYASNDKTSEALRAKQENLKDVFEEQKKKVEATQKALDELKGQEVQNTEAISRYEVALNNAKAAMMKTQNQITAMDKELEKSESASDSYKKTVSDIDRNLKVLGAELQTVAAKYSGNANSADALQAKGKLLNSVLDQQEKKVNELSKAYEAAKGDTGQMSDETADLKIELEQAKAAALKTKNEIDGLGSEMQDAGAQAQNASTGIDSIKSVAGGVTKAIGVITAAVGGLLAAFIASGEATREYRSDLSKLEQNTRSVSGSIDNVKNELKNLNAITGESDSNIEALSNLMAAGFKGEGLTEAVEGLSGAVIKFPDTIKIESLADGLQETLATGAATGQFGEVLERLGYNLVDFNEGLSKCATNAEKQDYALKVLASTGLAQVNAEYRTNNKELIAASNAQFKFNDSMARLGKIADPIVASAMDGLSDIIEMIADLVGDSALQDFIQDIMKLLKEIIRAVFPVVMQFIKWCIDNKEAVLSLLAGIAAGFAAFKVASVIMSVITAMKALVPVIQGADIATKALNGTMNLNPVLLIISGIIALTAAIATYVIEASKADEETQAIAENADAIVSGMNSSADAFSKTTTEIEAQANIAKGLTDELAQLEAKGSLTAAEQARMAVIVEKLNSLYPNLGVAIDSTTGKLNINTDAIYQSIEAQKEQAKAQAYMERNKELAGELVDAEAALYDAQAKRAKNTETLNNAEKERQKINDDYQRQLEKLNETETDSYLLNDEINKLVRERDSLLWGVTERCNEAEKSNAALTETETGLQMAYDNANAALDTNIEKINGSTQADQTRTDAHVANADTRTAKSAEELEAEKVQAEQAQAVYDERAAQAQDAFGRIKESTALTVSEMIGNLEANQSAISDWTANMGALANRGLDEGLLKALREAGPEAAGTVKNLVGASDSEIKSLNDVFKTGSKTAIDAMKMEMGLPTTTNSGADMIDDVAENVDKNTALKKSAVAAVAATKDAMNTQVSDSDFPDIGVQMVAGIRRGMNSQRDGLLADARQMADDVTKAFKVRLEIKSPSRRLDREVGVQMAAGVGRGWMRQMKVVRQNMEKSLPTSFDARAKGAEQKAGEYSYSHKNNGKEQATIVVKQYFYGNEYSYAKQQREAAKSFKQVAREMG